MSQRKSQRAKTTAKQYRPVQSKQPKTAPAVSQVIPTGSASLPEQGQSVTVSQNSPGKTLAGLISEKLTANMVISVLALAISLFSMWVSREQVKLSASVASFQINQSFSDFLVQNPELREYYFVEKETKTRLSNPAQRAIYDCDLRERYQNLDKETRGKVSLGCEKLADSFDQIFVQRGNLYSHDWNSWWNYMCDAYDESPILRDFYEHRVGWYLIDDYLKNSQKRQQLYRGRITDFLPIETDGALGDLFAMSPGK